MKKLFNNILVPVEFNRHSELALQKALSIANQFDCHLHVLHIESQVIPGEKTLLPPLVEEDELSAMDKLQQWKEKYSTQLLPGLQFFIIEKKGKKEQMIVEYVKLHQIDLIVIGKPYQLFPGNVFASVNINRLSRKTECPVLTVKAKSALEKVRIIVLPVDAHLPIRKIMFASYLARKFNARIHLIAVTASYPKQTIQEMAYLYKTYQLLKENTNLTIECHAVPGANIAETTLEYARQVNADLIVVNPGKELLLSGFMNRLFARFLFNESRIPVMTIAPVNR